MKKNITLSADNELIQKARFRAQNENTTLNEQFRIWLRNYAHNKADKTNYHLLMEKLFYVTAAGSFTRDEMNDKYFPG